MPDDHSEEIRDARERQRERAEHVENALDDTGDMLDEHKYPTTSEELATEYADQPIEMPNETESMGSVFDRLTDERYENAEEAREALYGELTGEESGPEEYNEERDLTDLAEDASERTRE